MTNYLMSLFLWPVLLLPAYVQAQAVAPITGQFVLVEGAPVILKLIDGREAQLFRVDFPDNTEFTIDVEIYESLCAKSQASKCDYLLNVSESLIYAVWTKHPDQSFLNQPVKHLAGEVASNLELQVPLKMNSNFNFNSRLVCKNLDWLSDEPIKIGTKLEIPLAYGDINVINFETSASENQIYQEAKSTQGLINSLTEISFIFDSSSQSPIEFPLLFIGDANATYFKPQSNSSDLCQVSSRTSLARFSAKFSDEQSKSKARSVNERLPYIYNKQEVDSLSKNRAEQVNGFLLGAYSFGSIDGTAK